MLKYLGCILTTALFVYADQSPTLCPEPPPLQNTNCYPKYFWYDLEALYLQADEEGVVATNKYAPVLLTDDFTQNGAVHPDFNWDWGFRIGMGAYFIPMNGA